MNKVKGNPEELSKEITSLQEQIEELEQRCAEAEEALDAIRRGVVDAFVVYHDEEEKIYTIEGAESTYRLLVESMNEGAATLIGDGTILYCNRRFAEMIKTPLETIIGTSIHQYITPENKAVFSSLLLRGLKENCRDEIYLLCKDGSTIPVMASLNNISTAGYSGICMVATDLTERKIAEEMAALVQHKIRAEEELRQAHAELEKTNEELKSEIAEHKRTEGILKATQQILQTVVDHIPAAVALIRGDELRLQLFNPTYQAIAPGKVMADRTIEEIWPETAKNFTNISRYVLDTGKPYQIENELNMIRRQPDGPLEQAYFSWSLHRVWLPGDLGLGLLLTAWETTARKQAEDALSESRRKYQDLIETTSEFIWEMDHSGRYTYCSPQMETLWGLKQEEMIGKSPFDLMPPAEKEKALEGFREMVKSTLPFRGLTSTAINGQGQLIYVESSGNPYFDQNGIFLGYRGITRDITDRKQAEEKLRHAFDELDQRVQERTRELIIVNEELKAEIAEREKAEMNARSNERLAEGLTQSVITMNSSLDLDYMLDTILEQLGRSVSFTSAGIILVEDGSLSVARYSSMQNKPEISEDAETIYSLVDYPLLSEIAISQQPIYIQDIKENPEWVPIPGTEWTRSFVAAPLITGGRVLGMISLFSDEPGAFSQETISRLMSFAAPAALAVQNARLFTAESHARQVAEVMSEMSLALTQTLNLDIVLRTLLKYLPKLVNYEGAYIVTLEDDAHFKLRATDGFENNPNPKRPTGTSINISEITYIEEVLNRQKSFLIPDTREYPDWETLVTRKEIRSWMGVPIVLRDGAKGLVGLVHTKPGAFKEEHLRFVESITAQVSIAIQNAWLFEQVRAGQERFQLLSRRLVEVQEIERSSIVRELHDETSQALTAIMFGLKHIEHEVNHPDKLLPLVADVKHQTDEVLESLHRLAMNLRPASLDHVGLLTALEQLVKDTGKRYHWNSHFKSELLDEDKRLPEEIETGLYRIVQEALTNIARHASAENVDVIIKLRNGKILIIIEDDGLGFDTAEIRERDKLGLIGMQERAQTMGGSLQIESTPGEGTTILVEVIYDDPHSDR